MYVFVQSKGIPNPWGIIQEAIATIAMLRTNIRTAVSTPFYALLSPITDPIKEMKPTKEHLIQYVNPDVEALNPKFDPRYDHNSFRSYLSDPGYIHATLQNLLTDSNFQGASADSLLCLEEKILMYAHHLHQAMIDSKNADDELLALITDAVESFADGIAVLVISDVLATVIAMMILPFLVPQGIFVGMEKLVEGLPNTVLVNLAVAAAEIDLALWRWKNAQERLTQSVHRPPLPIPH